MSTFVTVFKSRKANHLFYFIFLLFFSEAGSWGHWAAGTNSNLLLELLTGWLVNIFEDEGTRVWIRRRIPYHAPFARHRASPNAKRICVGHSRGVVI